MATAQIIANLSYIAGITADSTGNIYAACYVKETGLLQIQEIAAVTHAVSAIATGLDGATKFTNDNLGNIYVAEYSSVTYNFQIQKIAAGTHTVATIATGLENINDIATDGVDNVYVAEYDSTSLSAKIQKISAGTHIVSTIISGPASPAYQLAKDNLGNIYVAETSTHLGQIQEIIAGTNTVNTIATGLNMAQTPTNDALGNIYFVDYNNKSFNYDIKKIAAETHTITTVVNGTYAYVFGFATDGAGNVYLSGYNQTGNYYQINEIVAGTNIATTIAKGLKSNPSGFTADGFGNVYIADNSQIYEILSNSTPVAPIGVTDNSGNHYTYNPSTNTITQTLAGTNTTTTIASDYVKSDSSGNAYFYNASTNAIDKIAVGTGATTVVSSGATTAQTDNNQISVSQVYAAVMDRIPDASGSAFWTNAVNNGTSMATIAQGFTASPEFNSLYPSSSSTSAYVTAIYNNIFNRAPDSGGLTFWSNAIDSKAVTKAALITSMINSAMSQGSSSADYQGIFAKGDFGAWCVNNNITLTGTQGAALINSITNATTEAAAKVTAISETTTAPHVVAIVGVDTHTVA